MKACCKYLQQAFRLSRRVGKQINDTICAMKMVRVENQTRGTILATRCEIADNILTRVRGLLGRAGLEEGAALWIEPCPSVHMFGMKFAIDVLFVSRDGRVVDWTENLAPGAYYVAKAWENETEKIKAHIALELPAGTLQDMEIERGDLIKHREI